MKPEYETTGHRCELVAIGGYLFVHHSSYGWDRPVKTHRFYPTGILARLYKMPRIVRQEGGSGIYRDEQGHRFGLFFREKTKPRADLYHEDPYPCPVRCKKKEYRDGGWHKYTRAKGWQQVG